LLAHAKPLANFTAGIFDVNGGKCSSTCSTPIAYDRPTVYRRCMGTQTLCPTHQSSVGSPGSNACCIILPTEHTQAMPTSSVTTNVVVFIAKRSPQARLRVARAERLWCSYSKESKNACLALNLSPVVLMELRAWGSGAGRGADGHGGHEAPAVVDGSEPRVDPMVCRRPHLSPPSTSAMTTRTAAGGLTSCSENHHHCLVPP
jgi:hypothetical protein